MSKEQFLKLEGQKITRDQAVGHTDFENVLVVALLHNPTFTAACIAFDENELKVVTDPTDHRPIEFYKVCKSELLENSNLNEYLN